MSTNNTFSLPRFIQLAKQNFTHNQRLILLTLVGFCGALFMLFFFIQLTNDLRQGTDPQIFVPVFMVVLIGGGVLFIGNAFPGFRSKEKTISFLMLPASSFEKYLLELLSRLTVLLVIVPVLFWSIFHLEGFVFQIFYSDASFSMMELSSIPNIIPDDPASTWIKALIVGAGLMGLLIAFTGAAHFERYPLVKTMVIVAVIFFSAMAVLYVVIEKMGLSRYNPNESLWLFPHTGKGAVGLVAIIVWLVDLVLLASSFLKITEREV